MKNLVLKPVISEKSIDLASTGKYIFDVPTNANKIEIAKAVSAEFKVKVIDVNSLTRIGKTKKLRGVSGKRSNVKKAIVTLKKGDKIAAFAVEEEAK